MIFFAKNNQKNIPTPCRMSHVTHFKNGFTLVELLFVVFILLLLGAAIIPQVRTLQENNKLKLAAEQVKSAMVEAQNLAFGAESPSVYGYGVYLNSDSTVNQYYILFRDCAPGAPNTDPCYGASGVYLYKYYYAGNARNCVIATECIKTYKLPQNVIIESFSSCPKFTTAATRINFYWLPPKSFERGQSNYSMYNNSNNSAEPCGNASNYVVLQNNITGKKIQVTQGVSVGRIYVGNVY